MEIFAWTTNFFIDALKVVLVLGFLIFIHELGHFVVAKWVGIRVHEFALGFGTKLLSLTKGETTYSIRLFPIGGFVRMEGEEQQSDDERSFSKKSIPARIAVVFSGPLMNIMLALLILVSFVMYSGRYVSNELSTVDPEYGAWAAGIRAGDEIVSINDRPVRIWDDVNWIMLTNGGREAYITVERNDRLEKFAVKPTLQLNFDVDESNVITSIKQESSLDRLGLKTGDRIVGINGTSVNSPEQVQQAIAGSESKFLVFGLQRGGEYVQKEFDSTFVRRYILGLIPTEMRGYSAELMYYSFWKSVFLIKVMTVEISKLFTGGIPLNQVMGPVGIISEISSREVIADLLWLMAIISLNLGIVNLIPFPPLDGGKILTLLLEAVRRKPIKPESEAMISMVGFSLLIMLLIFVTFNDIARSALGG